MSFLSWLRNRKPSNSVNRRRKQAADRLMLEALEGRALPSGYTAASVSDLIAAINAANAAGGANTITLTAPAPSPYDLAAVNNSTDGPTGLPIISGGGRKSGADNLTIIGNGDIIERSTASGTPAFRLFDVASHASLTLVNLTLQNGRAYGSGAAAEGGAVYSQGTLVLDGVKVQGNIAQGADGGSITSKKTPPPGADAGGGAVWSNGSLTLKNSIVMQNNWVGSLRTANYAAISWQSALFAFLVRRWACGNCAKYRA